MEDVKEDFLTPEERASLGPKEANSSRVLENSAIKLGTRPTIITVLCGYFFVNWFRTILLYIGMFSQPSAFSLNFGSISGLNGWGGLAIFIATLSSVVGYWFMKKWAVYLYVVVFVISFMYDVLRMGSVSFAYILGLILPAFFIFIGFKYLRQMN